MNARVAPAGRGLRGTVPAPADKSLSHRAALLGAMSDAPVHIRGYLDAADTRSTLEAVRAVGAELVSGGPGELVVHGVGLRGARPAAIDVGNAGTLLRLMPGWLAGQPAGGSWTLDGDASIRRRPVDRIAEPLRALGARVEARGGRFPPLVVHGSPLRGTEYELPVASAQVKSCVLLAGLLAEGATTVREPVPSRDHTERLLLAAGVPLTRDGLAVRVESVENLALEEVRIPGDPSSAAFLVAAALLVPGSAITIAGVATNWTRTGFLRIVERMGGGLLGVLEGMGTPPTAYEPVADLEVEHAALTGTLVEPDEVPLTIDELPLVALLACFAEGETVLVGAGELRYKESDRIATVVSGLRGLGAEIEATEDGWAVRGGGGLRGGILHAHGDHRLALLGAVAGLASQEGVEVVGMEAAEVSYPSFEADVTRLLG